MRSFPKAKYWLTLLLLLPQIGVGQEPEALPPAIRTYLDNHCLSCHDAETSKGDLSLERGAVDWTQKEQRALWERVLDVTHDRRMPPPKKTQPEVQERASIEAWIHDRLLAHTPIGGTPPRRLNREEYETSIRSICGLPTFKVPMGFPPDREVHGLNNLAEGLLLSPPLLEAYTEAAWDIADQFYPPQGAAPTSTLRRAGPEDLVISFSAASVRDNALRLASRCPTIMRSSTWPSRMEVTSSGRYRISIDASTFRPADETPMILEVRARELSASDRSLAPGFRHLKDIKVSDTASSQVTFEADLYQGQTLLLRWRNAPMDHDQKPLRKHMEAWFKRDPRFLAAWQQTVMPKGLGGGLRTASLRGRNGWNMVRALWKDPALDLSQATMDNPLTTRLLGLFESNQGTFNFADALCHYYFEHGPSLEIHGITLEGPLELIDGPDDLKRAARREQLTGPRDAGQSDEAFARQMLKRVLPRAFRRPVSTETTELYLSMATRHWAEGHRFEEGMHLLLRNIFISPRFLYRSLRDGETDDHELATRLSFFLARKPPDATLIDLAQRSRLRPDWVLERETTRLMPLHASSPFVKHVTRQWLDTALLHEIMPDPVFRFGETHLSTAQSEVESFFAAMIRENRPMTDFIDPDFTYTSPFFARDVYDLPFTATEAKDRKVKRISLQRGGRVGGLLGQSAIHIVTANGVDTQPILRGVWVLENLLGSPTPPPPADVPALTPDTRGTSTPRERLAAHTSEAGCASCHQHIDPVGLLLESFDPVGRWRENWPGKAGPIDTQVTLHDGSEMDDVTDLKRWVLANIDLFSQCLSEKLMASATGRMPNYAERQEIAMIVRQNRERHEGFRDLIHALIQSRTFRTP